MAGEATAGAAAVGSLADLNPWTAALAAIPGVISAGKGIVDIISGKNMARNNPRPIYDNSAYYNQILQMMEKNAQYGLDANSLAFSTDRIDRGFTGSLNAMLQAGGDPNTASGVYDTYAASFNQLGAQDAAARWNKVNAVSGAISGLANEKATEFLYNEDAPYKDTAQLASAKQQAGNAGLYMSLDSISGNLLKLLNTNYQNTPSHTDTAPGALPSTPPVVIHNNVTPSAQISPEAMASLMRRQIINQITGTPF